MSLDTKKCFSTPLSIFYKASRKARKCFVLTVLDFFAPKLPSCLMTLLCGLKLGWQIVSKDCGVSNNSLLSTRNLLNCLPKALVFGPAHLASGRQRRNSVLMKCTNDTKLRMAAGDCGSWRAVKEPHKKQFCRQKVIKWDAIHKRKKYGTKREVSIQIKCYR